jgi:Ser/Thr protein kinase RdoA (MazF antagonist)
MLVGVGELAARLHDALDHYPDHDAFVADRQKSANEWGMHDEALWPLLRELPEHALIPPDEQTWLRAIDERALAYLQERYPEPTRLTLALLHGDLNFEHIQFLPDGVPYLFDFGDLCWGPVAHELGVFFLNTVCSGELSFSHWEAMRQRILAGYRATRPLSERDEAMIPVFMLNRVLGWARYRVELSRDARIPLHWPFLKRAHRVAEYLLNRADEMNTP